MPRAKSSVTHKRRVNKVLKQSKGYFGKRKNVYTVAKVAVKRSLAYAFAHRRKKKGDFRTLWTIRINAALEEHGISYSKFIGALVKSGIIINRKVLSNLAIEDTKSFKTIVDIAKKNI